MATERGRSATSCCQHSSDGGHCCAACHLLTCCHHTTLLLLLQIMVGRLGAMDISAYFLAQTLTSATGARGLELCPLQLCEPLRLLMVAAGLAVVFGIGSGLDTFAGQAFGANRHALLGIVLQRAILLSLLASVPCIALWVLAGEWLLRSLGERVAVAGVVQLCRCCCS